MCPEDKCWSPELSRDALGLLIEVAEDTDPVIQLTAHMTGRRLKAGSLNMNLDDSQEVRHWQEVIHELLAAGLVNLVDSKGEFYRLTKEAVELARSSSI